VEEGKVVARLQSGDPSIYGALQRAAPPSEGTGRALHHRPRRHSASAAAAWLQIEPTVPELSQTVIMTRRSGRATSFRMGMRCLSGGYQAHWLSSFQLGKIERCRRGSHRRRYRPATRPPYTTRSWPDEDKAQGTLADIALRIARSAGAAGPINVGEVLARTRRRSARAL